MVILYHDYTLITIDANEKTEPPDPVFSTMLRVVELVRTYYVGVWGGYGGQIGFPYRMFSISVISLINMKHKLINLFLKIPFKKILVFLGIVCVLFLIVYPAIIYKSCNKKVTNFISKSIKNNESFVSNINDITKLQELRYNRCKRSWGLD